MNISRECCSSSAAMIDFTTATGARAGMKNRYHQLLGKLAVEKSGVLMSPGRRMVVRTPGA
jgi:hypothetical protein